MVQAIAEADRGELPRGAPGRIGVAGKLEGDSDILQRCHGRNQVKRLEHDADLAAAEAR